MEAHPILNSAIADKEKFKEIMLQAIHLMGEARNDKYSFYTEEALDVYKEMCPFLKMLGFTDEIHLNVQSFRMTLFYVMSIIHMLLDGVSSPLSQKNVCYGNNVIDFEKYKDMKKHKREFLNRVS